MTFAIGDIVVVKDGHLVGVVCDIWASDGDGYRYSVYVREWHTVKEYKCTEIERYRAIPCRLGKIELLRQEGVEDHEQF